MGAKTIHSGTTNNLDKQKENDMATQTQPRQERFEAMRESHHGGDDAMQPFNDLYQYFTDYARKRPDVVALWCFGIGFILGWKLKPW
jgi:hypothetical protein